MRNHRDYDDSVELLEALEKALNQYEHLAWKNGVPRHDPQIESAKMTFQKFGGYFETEWRLKA